MIIAGVLFYADWKLGWDATKVYTAPACVAYFILNGALTYWISFVEGGKVFVGTREGGQKVYQSASVNAITNRCSSHSVPPLPRMFQFTN